MIPIFNLSRIHKPIEKELKKVFLETLLKGNFILGENVSAFEKEFAKYTGCSYGVGVGSGTDALSLAMEAVGVKSGDEVILPANAYPTVFAITAIGAIPKPVDIDSTTYCLDPKKLEKSLSKKVKAVIVVHMYGRAADILAIKEITDKYKIPLIEDCAHAHGLGMGTFGDVSCFSFYPTKNLGALGDGGMVCTNNPEIYEKVKLLRMYGEKARYVSVALGKNSRLDELQAGLLRVKLKYLDEWNRQRREIADTYDKNLSINIRCHSRESGNPILEKKSKNKTYLLGSGSPIRSGMTERSVYHLYIIRSNRHAQLMEYLKTRGIGTGIHYPTPVHLIPSMNFLGYKKGDFPHSEKASEEVVSLPMWPGLKKSEVEKVCKAIKEFYNDTILQ